MRIVLVSLDNVGDTIFASALVDPLRQRFQDARIVIWSKAYAAEVAGLIPGVDAVVASDTVWDAAPGRGKGTWLPFLRAAAALRRERFDVALLADAPWRAAAAVRALGIPVRIGLRRRHNAAFLSHALPPEDKTRPVLTEMARLLEPLGIAVPAPRYRLDASRLKERAARMQARMHGAVAALHPFASCRDRCAPLAVWLGLAHALEARGLTPLWIGDARELSEVRAAGGRGLFVDSLGDGGLADTAAAVAQCRLLVGHDSGPLHIASALGVPAVGVFAPGEPQRTFPQGTGAWRLVARAAPAAVTTQDVLDAVDDLGR